VTDARVEDLLRDGIVAAKAGDKETARQLFGEVTAREGRNETASLWLAGLAESPDEALVHLERVLAFNPEHERARSAIRTARVQAGVNAARAGEKARAQTLLRAAVANDPEHELAWIWLASVAQSPAEAVHCLERVLTLNPNNERARAGLERYRTTMPELLGAPAVAPSALTQPDPEPPFECPFCGRAAAEEREECDGCGALLTLAAPECYLEREGVDSEKLQAAIERLQGGNPETHFDASFQLGLAWLNLGELATALPWFETALRRRPDERELRDWLHALLGQEATIPPSNELAPDRRSDSTLRAGSSRRFDAVADARRPSGSRRKTILVVDDSPTIRKLVSLTVERGGYQARVAADAYEAIDLLRDHGVPDMILLDLSMPGMDGYQLCKLLRQSDETAALPIVMLSGKDGFFSKVRGRMCGSTEYLTKPFDPDGLLRVVEKYCPLDDAAPEAAPARG
jgi:twitching motility two-component system response regulator PilG